MTSKVYILGSKQPYFNRGYVVRVKTQLHTTVINYIVTSFRNCVNLLTNYQGDWTNPLIEPFDKAFATADLQEVEYDGNNMNAPQILLDFLDHNLTKVSVYLMEYLILSGIEVLN